MLPHPEPLGAPFQGDLIPSIVCEGVMIALGLNHLSTLNCSRNCPSLPIISLKSMAIQRVDGPTTYSHFRVRFFGPVLPRLSSAGHRDGGVCAELHWGGEVLSGCWQGVKQETEQQECDGNRDLGQPRGSVKRGRPFTVFRTEAWGWAGCCLPTPWAFGYRLPLGGE